MTDLLDPDMPASQLRLHMGEMTAQEMRTARAAIRWANTALAAAQAQGREEGAVEMRERAAQEAEAARVQSYTPHQHPEKIAARIRALPTTGGTVPAKASGGGQ